MGITEVRHVPDDFPLNYLQSIIRQAVSDRRDIAHGDLASSLAGITSPVRYLDFETFQPAIPRFAGTRPYDQIPFLFSVHTETYGGPPEHMEYMHEDDSDPRPALIERLLESLEDEGSICVYSSFERTQIKALAAAFPEYAGALDVVATRLVDLHQVVRGSYYHPGFHGSFSLKSVVPVVAPHLSYGGWKSPMAKWRRSGTITLHQAPTQESGVGFLTTYALTAHTTLWRWWNCIAHLRYWHGQDNLNTFFAIYPRVCGAAAMGRHNNGSGGTDSSCSLA